VIQDIVDGVLMLCAQYEAFVGRGLDVNIQCLHFLLFLFCFDFGWPDLQKVKSKKYF